MKRIYTYSTRHHEKSAHWKGHISLAVSISLMTKRLERTILLIGKNVNVSTWNGHIAKDCGRNLEHHTKKLESDVGYVTGSSRVAFTRSLIRG